MFDFEKLEVYSKVEHVTHEIFRNILTSHNLDLYVKDQLKRSILSVMLNIAEGAGRITEADKRHFYVVARASTFEVVAILRLLLRQEIISAELYTIIYGELEQISKMLLALIKK